MCTRQKRVSCSISVGYKRLVSKSKDDLNFQGDVRTSKSSLSLSERTGWILWIYTYYLKTTLKVCYKKDFTNLCISDKERVEQVKTSTKHENI